jgi:hypothetical protein
MPELDQTPEPCRFGRTEYDGARYCHEHASFLEAGVQSRRCDEARITPSPERKRS